MLKKLLMGGMAAGVMAVPLAGVAWADPMPNPSPTPMPNPSGQNPATANPGAVPESNAIPGAVPEANPTMPGMPGAMPEANPAMPAGAGSSAQGPTCVVSANAPAPTVNNAAQGAPVTWLQVATLEGSVASQLGMPAAPTQMMKVFCAPVGSLSGAAEQPTGLSNPGQPTGMSNPGQPNPAQNPVQPGQTGPQNPMPGQQ
jgi:hypothetical protein